MNINCKKDVVVHSSCMLINCNKMNYIKSLETVALYNCNTFVGSIKLQNVTFKYLKEDTNYIHYKIVKKSK